ncbi:hypothetical protein [Paludisphaera sp.]|uniref:hypothetical protein n=1 Tax=Paludisphaera sp. TaxID=2017432 RepID=UPI00301DCDF5
MKIRRFLAACLVAAACFAGCPEPASTPPPGPAVDGPPAATKARIGKRARPAKEPIGPGTPKPGTAPSPRIRDDL